MNSRAVHQDTQQVPGSDDAEHRFALRIARALDESASRLSPSTLERLAAARKSALRAQKQPEPGRAPAWQPSLGNAGGGSAGGPRRSRFGFARAGLVGSALILVGVCLAGLYNVEQQRRIEDLADMDAAVLDDDLPISAYADHGFNAFLKQNP